VDIYNLFTKLLETSLFPCFSSFNLQKIENERLFIPQEVGSGCWAMLAFEKWSCDGFGPTSVVKKVPPLPLCLVRRVFTEVKFYHLPF
jgi:hypothetical protein